MSRDFARSEPHRRGRPRSASSGRRSAKAPFLLGLTLGLSVALGVFLVDHGYVSLAGLSGDQASPSAPPQPRPAARPRFDFYTILPEMEVVIPEGPMAGADAAVRPAPASSSTPQAVPMTPTAVGGYILQAGSFRSAADADALKAQLALLGYQASVQTVTINQDTYHRVRLGPFADLERANSARARLGENAVATLLLRLKG